MDNAESEKNASPSPSRSRNFTRRTWSKIKDWTLIGVALLTFGTVIDNNFNIREANRNVVQSEHVLKSSRPPSVISSELKSIKEAYFNGGLDDKALISWLEAINADQNKLIATSCSLEQKHQLEALETDMKVAEAFNRLRREFPTASNSRKRELIEMLLIVMDQRNSTIQKSCMNAWFRNKKRKLSEHTTDAA